VSRAAARLPGDPPPPTADRPLLALEGLTVRFPGPAGPVEAVSGVSLTVDPGEIVGLVGESGSGKSLTALAVLRLVPPPGKQEGSIRFEGRELGALREGEMRAVRGRRIAIVFQEPGAALDPVIPIGSQIAETLAAHGLPRRALPLEVRRALARVALHPDLAGRYPHQLSGGQRQRALIAMALAPGPVLLLADEPTTALDTTIQASILDLLRRLRDEEGLAILLISHDLAVVSETCDRVAVMHAGRIVEEAAVRELVERPVHPYTRELWRASRHLELALPEPRG
jgi:ABC-type glutathione transport system ATPase component